MANATIFAHLGVFVRRRFLSAESCLKIRSEMSSSTRTPAMIRPFGEADGSLDETVRRTGVAPVSARTAALVEERLLATKPELEKHFAATLTGWQRLQFYIYEEGGFFTPHRDRDDTDPLAPDWVKARQISVSILLNDERGGPDGESYRGGALVFYGRRGDRDGAGFRMPLAGEEGMLIAFRSDWIHEVQPVTSGRRYSIVTWFL